MIFEEVYKQNIISSDPFNETWPLQSELDLIVLMFLLSNLWWCWGGPSGCSHLSLIKESLRVIRNTPWGLSKMWPALIWNFSIRSWRNSHTVRIFWSEKQFSPFLNWNKDLEFLSFLIVSDWYMHSIKSWPRNTANISRWRETGLS